MQYWVEQHERYGLGNFINCTPTIRKLYEEDGPVPVWFATKYVRDCFENSQYIEILEDRPNTNPLFSSSMTNQKEADWKYIYKKVIGTKNWKGDFPAPFVGFSYIVLINGSGNYSNPDYCRKKQIDPDILDEILDLASKEIVIGLGSVEDERFNSGLMIPFVTEMDQILMYLQAAKYVIANDSGLYHAAGAMGKTGFILWKDTSFVKNKCPNENFDYSFDNYIEDFKGWLKNTKNN